MRDFFEREQLTSAICITGSVPHNMFLTMMKRSLAYIRMPLTDGVCSSVLAGLTMKVPVIASDKGARPVGAEVWKPGDADRLLYLLTEAAERREQMVARIPSVALDDNAAKLADDIEEVCLGGSARISKSIAIGETRAADGR